MKLVNVKITDLKRLPDSPIREERYHNTPLVIINENNEILFGENVSSSPFFNEDGTLTCLCIPSSEQPSKRLSFDLHYLGMTGIIDFENFNSMPKDITGAPYDLYLWDEFQFEANVKAKSLLKDHSNETYLF